MVESRMANGKRPSSAVTIRPTLDALRRFFSSPPEAVYAFTVREEIVHANAVVNGKSVVCDVYDRQICRRGYGYIFRNKIR